MERSIAPSYVIPDPQRRAKTSFLETLTVSPLLHPHYPLPSTQLDGAWGWEKGGKNCQYIICSIFSTFYLGWKLNNLAYFVSDSTVTAFLKQCASLISFPKLRAEEGPRIKRVWDGRTVTGDNSHIIASQRGRRIRKDAQQTLTELTPRVKEEGKRAFCFISFHITWTFYSKYAFLSKINLISLKIKRWEAS